MSVALDKEFRQWIGKRGNIAAPKPYAKWHEQLCNNWDYAAWVAIAMGKNIEVDGEWDTAEILDAVLALWYQETKKEAAAEAVAGASG